LDTCHLSPEESIALVKRAREKNVKHIVVNHPVTSVINASIEQQIIMANDGAYMNQVFATFSPYIFDKGAQEMVEAIKAVGPERCIISSDAGHVTINNPVEAFRQFITILLFMGLSEREIDLMARKNPEKILGLSSSN
jgi:predicted TIM-barrel fold metal-dependent hydrolase